MCGIVGYLRGEPAEPDPKPVISMLMAIAHRGPDGYGYTLSNDGSLALGHHRLAILDRTDAGNQPMSTRDGRHVITFAGEIYNHAELRAELEALGRECSRSRTDTEVVLAAYAEWGEAAVPRLNGMFAFAIWDFERHELFLARDRYGQKPLYVAQHAGVFVFASEVKAMLAGGLLPATTVDRGALAEYFTFQNILSSRTLFKGIRILPAGCTMLVKAGTNLLLPATRYWDWQFEADPALRDEREVASEVLRLLEQSVRRQLVADVDVGAFLSGGIDSTAIVTLAAREKPHLRTFTAGFDLRSVEGIEVAADERHVAELVSHAAGTEHYEVVLKSGDMERSMPLVARAIEEPRVGQSYPNHYVAKLASKYNSVALSGAGGDEIFGGYPWRYEDNASFWSERLVTNDLWKRLFPSLPATVLDPSWQKRTLNDVLTFEAQTFLHGLLVVEDKLAMAHGLEVRFPFLDNDLVDFAVRIPPAMKVKNGSAVPIGKHVLREAVRPIVPGAVADRKKQGFSAPDGSWFRGESLAWVRRELCEPQARVHEYVDERTLAGVLEEHVSGHVNRRLLIWSLLSVEYFLREFVV